MTPNYIQKKPEMTRIADAFSGYIHRHPNLDLVWSRKRVCPHDVDILPTAKAGGECQFLTLVSKPSMLRPLYPTI